MNLTGIITEYNPFHNGHKLHLETAKRLCKSDGIVCIMSGNFVQRGEAAILDKWTRAEMAIKNGVDLVIELPTHYALSSAENFAYGSVFILDKLNCINNLFFGSELGSISPLENIANILTFENEQFKENLKYSLDLGLSYAKSRENALVSTLENNLPNIKDIISSSNNILGIEYIKAILKLNSNIKPKTFKREGSNYNDTTINSVYASATSIRKALKNHNDFDSLSNYLPYESIELLQKNLCKIDNINFEDKIFDFLKFKLLTNCTNFNNLKDINEGLNNKLIKEIISCNNLNEYILRCKSKRYTYTKISRIMTKLFIGYDAFNEVDLNSPSNIYCRVLGFNSKGREILKTIKKSSDINIITKVGKYTNNTLLDLDIQATKAYSLLNNTIRSNEDYLRSPINLD